MRDNTIGAQVRRSNRNLVITNVAILAALAAAAYFNARYFDNMLRGPFPMSGAALAAAADPAALAHNYVTLQGSQAVDTGVTQIQQQVDSASGKVTSQNTVAHYLVLRDGNRLVVVKAPNADANQLRYTGVLVPLPGGIAARVVTPVAAQEGASGLPFSNAMLDAATNFRAPGVMGLVLGLPLLALCFWNLRRAAARRDPEAHPAVRALARYGAPHSIVDEIDGELQGGGAERIGGTTLTAHWLLYPTLFGFQVLSLKELVWLYEQVTTTKYMGIIPMGKRRSALLLDAQRKTIRIDGRRGSVEPLLQRVAALAPWAVAGFNAQIQQTARKDFPALVAAVAERRQRAAAGHAGGASA